jgi:hypothetical protein
MQALHNHRSPAASDSVKRSSLFGDQEGFVRAARWLVTAAVESAGAVRGTLNAETGTGALESRGLRVVPGWIRREASLSTPGAPAVL